MYSSFKAASLLLYALCGFLILQPTQKRLHAGHDDPSADVANEKSGRFTVAVISATIENSSLISETVDAVVAKVEMDIPSEYLDVFVIPSPLLGDKTEAVMNRLRRVNPCVIVFVVDHDYIRYVTPTQAAFPDVRILVAGINIEPAQALALAPDQSKVTVVDATPNFKAFFEQITPLVKPKSIGIVGTAETVSAQSLIAAAVGEDVDVVDLGPIDTWEDYKRVARAANGKYDLLFLGTPHRLLLDFHRPLTVEAFRSFVREIDKTPTAGWIFKFGRTFEITVATQSIGRALGEACVSHFAGTLDQRVFPLSLPGGMRVNGESIARLNRKMPIDFAPYLDMPSYFSKKESVL